MERQAVLGDHGVETSLQGLGERVEVRIRGRREDLEQGHARRRHRQRIAIEGAHLRDTLLLDDAHHIRATADGATRKPAADRLGQGDQVGCHPEALGGATGSDGHARLDLVEDQERALTVSQVAQPRQVALVRQHDADVHHRRLDDHRRDLARMFRKRVGRGRQVVERNDGRQLDHRGGDALALRDRRRLVGRPHLVRRRLHRHHQSVVMAVV